VIHITIGDTYLVGMGRRHLLGGGIQGSLNGAEYGEISDGIMGDIPQDREVIGRSKGNSVKVD